MAPDRPDPPSDEVVVVRDVSLSPDDDPAERRQKLARVILDELYEFVGLLDAGGRILEINRAALEGAGIRLEDIAGTPFWDAHWWAVSGESRDEARAMVLRASNGEFVRRDVEVYGRSAGRRTITVDFSLTPIRDSEGRVAFLLPEGRNITDKKRAEAALARRTEEIQELLDRVRELDEARSSFFANVSHELRTPLSLILGPIEDLLAGGSLDETGRSRLEVVRRNAGTLLRQVEALLDLARSDAGRLEPRYERIDLAELVRTAAAHFEALGHQRHITYLVDTDPVLVADVDPDRYERIVLNLLSNAFKFTPEGGWIRCRLERSGGRRVLLSVQDSGPGIEPALRTEVFERFQRGRVTRESADGIGLGLAIVKQLTDLHDGTVTVADAPLGGAMFQVEVPRTAPGSGDGRTRDPLVGPGRPTGQARSLDPDAEPGSGRGRRRTSGPAPDVAGAPEVAVAPDVSPVVEVAGSSPQAPTVLVVEDHPDMRSFIVGALQGEWRVLASGDAAEALRAMLTEPPDLVVTDLMLPAMSGEELIAAMRSTPELREVPVLVLSARADDGLRVELLAGPVQDYLIKPFAARELRARVGNLVTTKLARDALRAELDTRTGDLSVLADRVIAGRRALQASHDALQRSEQRWRAVYESSATGIAVLDVGGRILAANPALSAMLGYPEVELCGRSVAELCVPEEREVMGAELLGLSRLGRDGRRVERRLLRADGSVLWLDASLALAPASADTEPMVVCVVEDVTERNEATAALAAARNDLARVTRATALGAVAASMAHELNQPLAAISANADACLRWLSGPHRDEAEAVAAVERIGRDAKRASDVIGGIRRFLGRGGVRREPVDVDRVVLDVTTLLAAHAEAAGVVLERRLGAPPPVEADQVQIQQIVVNLVTNSIEAMAVVRPGGGTRRAVGIETSGRCGTVSLRVVDRGAGIEPERTAEVFEAFHTTKPDGMGMGLAISRSIAESHGGTLTVERTGPEGTSMLLVLPVRPSPGDGTPE